MDKSTYGQLTGLVIGLFIMFLIAAWVGFAAGRSTMTPKIDVNTPVHVNVPETKVELPEQKTPNVEVTVPTPKVSVYNSVPHVPAPVVNVHVTQDQEAAPPEETSSKPGAKAVPKPRPKVEAKVSVTKFEERDPHGKLLPPPKDAP